MKNILRVFCLLTFFFAHLFLLAQESKSLFEKGVDAYLIRDYENAHLYFDQGIKYRDELIFNHYFYKGNCYFEVREYELAEESLDICLKINEENPNYEWIISKTWWMLGRVYANTNRVEEEIWVYKKSLEFEENPNLYNNIGLAYANLDSLKKAHYYLTKCIKMDRENAYSYNNRAWLLIKMKRFKEAFSDLEKSKSFAPKNPHLHRNYGLYFIGIGDLDSACKSLSEAESLGYSKLADEKEKMIVQNLIKEHCLNLGIRQ